MPFCLAHQPTPPPPHEHGIDLRDTDNSQLKDQLLLALLGTDQRAPFPKSLRPEVERSGDQELFAWVLLGESAEALFQGHLEDSLRFVEQGREMLSQLAEKLTVLEPTWLAARMHSAALHLLGYPKAGDVHIGEALEIARSLNSPDLIATSLLDLGRSAQRDSQLADAHSLFTEALRQRPSKPITVFAMHSLGDLFHANAEPAYALRYHEIARKSLHLLSATSSARLRNRYARTLIERGELAGARIEIDLAHKLVAPYSAVANTSIRISNAELLIAEGREQEAEAEARTAIDVLGKINGRIYKAWASECLATVLTNQGRSQEALNVLGAVSTSSLLSTERERFYHLVGLAHEQLGNWREASDAHDILLDILSKRHEQRETILASRQASNPAKEATEQTEVLDERIEELTALRLNRDETIRIVTRDVKQPLAELQETIHQIAVQHQAKRPVEASVLKATVSIRAINGITSQLATNGELDAGRLAANLGTVALAKVVTTSMSVHQDLAATRDIVLSTRIPPELKVHADAGLLGQVLSALVHSAIRCSPMGSIVRLNAKTLEGNRVRLIIHDDGPSFTTDDLASIFERHAAPGTTRSSRGDTCGLGLFISRRLMTAMNGSVSRVRPRLEVGESFEVTLQVARSLGSLTSAGLPRVPSRAAGPDGS